VADWRAVCDSAKSGTPDFFERIHAFASAVKPVHRYYEPQIRAPTARRLQTPVFGLRPIWCASISVCSIAN